MGRKGKTIEELFNDEVNAFNIGERRRRKSSPLPSAATTSPPALNQTVHEEEVPEAPAIDADTSPPKIDLIVCQDSNRITNNAKEVAKILHSNGHNIHVESVDDCKQLLERLRERHSQGLPAPTDIIMDVGGGGASGAANFLRLFETLYPDMALPTINFCSLNVDAGIDSACKLRQSDGRILAGVIESAELSWTFDKLRGDLGSNRWAPLTTTLRELLNERLGCAVPLDQRHSDIYSERLKNMNEIANDGVLSAWRQGKMSAGEAIERMRGFATGLAESLCNGYMQGGDVGGLEKDAAFYGSAGYPQKGRVIFSLQEAENVDYNTAERPILVMRNYDPAVVPLMAEGKLSGLVVTSSFMASHLKLMCETHMVTGLFGQMPAGTKTLTGEFNEEAQPDGPAYFTGDEITINGQTIRRGQQILIGLDGNGLMANPPHAVTTSNSGKVKIEEADKFKINMLNKCFEEYFREQGLPEHGLKANVDGDRKLDTVNGIGLVRTEQMAAGYHYLLEPVKSALLNGEAMDSAYAAIADESRYCYTRLIQKLNDGQPVKIRLFDFVHSEILNKDEQKQFLEKYPRLDIHGGEALATWPRLYREQVRTIFSALAHAGVTSGVPLEIMMPAVRTEEDVLAIKQIVEEEAAAAAIKPNQYSFGVMAETLACCENIEKIAPLCDFISFGTNDLTQQYTGMERGDLKAHAKFAVQHGYDPFKVLDPAVMDIVRDVTARGRQANPSLKVDICGAQAANPDTAMELFRAGVDNISVTPTEANMQGLPLLLGYRMYDDAQQNSQVAHKPAAARPKTACG